MALAKLVKPGDKVRLKDVDPKESAGLSREDADTQLAALNAQLTALQEQHFAAGQNGVLIVLQGLDTAGKDGTIRHVMGQFNPAGCRVEVFKAPSPEELAHDFLWRVHRVTPARGIISIFNRSHYEDVLVVRVNELAPKKVWKARYEQINHFEELLLAGGTIVLKFFLHVSKEEQRARLLAREGDRKKAWKLSPTDWTVHEQYDQYLAAYQDALRECSTEQAPWYIVPADHKWFRNLAVARTIVDVLDPYRARWKADLEERGRRNLAALASLHAPAPPPTTP